MQIETRRYLQLLSKNTTFGRNNRSRTQEKFSVAKTFISFHLHITQKNLYVTYFKYKFSRVMQTLATRFEEVIFNQLFAY